MAQANRNNDSKPARGVPKSQRAAEKALRKDTLFLEMQEEMSRDEMVRFFSHNSNRIVTALVIILLVVSGYKIWDHFHTKKLEDAGIKLFEVVVNPQDAETAEKLKEIEGIPVYSEMAKLDRAQILLQTGQTEEAQKLFEELAADKSAEQPFRELAALNAVNLLLNADPKNPEIEKKLAPLTGDKSTYKYTAREFLAIYHIENGQKKEAQEILEELAKNPETPISISQRARQILTQL